MGDFHWQKEISYYNIEIIKQGAKNWCNASNLKRHTITQNKCHQFRNAPAPTEAIARRVAHVATSAMIVLTFGAVCFASSVCWPENILSDVLFTYFS